MSKRWTLDDYFFLSAVNIIFTGLIAWAVAGYLFRVDEKMDRVGAKVDGIEKLLDTKGGSQ